MSFTFLDPEPLGDRDLSLIVPEVCWIDEVLKSSSHPITARESPADASLTRRKVMDFLASAPAGHQPPDPARGLLPAYHFWMLLSEPVSDPPIRIAGGIGLRIGTNPEIQLYSGNFGYHVYPPARGNHYAERACRLLLPLARRHGLDQIWITCNPDNWASRRTCERLGARLVEIVTIPSDHPFRSRGETAKCRFILPT